MDLTSPHAFWLLCNGVGEVAPPLSSDRRCDVVVIGAGITGALVCDALTGAGLSVIAVDRRHPAHGSTSASTALLQYELDVSLADLTKDVGEERALDVYHAAADGVEAIAHVCDELDVDVGFKKRPTLYFASRARDVAALRKECAARQRAHLPCEILDRGALREVVDFKAPLALWSTLGAEVDPWRLTRALLDRCARRGLQVYGRTEVTRIVTEKSHLEVRTDRGKISAEHVVVATGYEAGQFLPKSVAKLHSTYAIVTEPVRSFDGWKDRCLIWESARPYIYARTTPDNRIMIGGADDPFRDPAHRDARVPKKALRLLARARRLFPRIEMELAYAWAGTFAETPDGLPFIGEHPQCERRIHFALAYGANGIPFGSVAGEVLTSSILGRYHRYKHTFGFDR
ncbi:MAG TPA: FAD-dependent oxidoreductase [Gemmatimonadaceae bacterium]